MKKKIDVLADLPLEVVKFPYDDGVPLSVEACRWIAEHIHYAAFRRGDGFLTVRYRGDGTPPPVMQKEDGQSDSATVYGNVPTPPLRTQEFRVPSAVVKKAAARTQKQPKPIQFVDRMNGE